MFRSVPLLMLSAAALAANATAADAARLKFDKPCYLAGATMTGTGTGFHANEKLVVGGNLVHNAPVSADRRGKVTLQYFAPLPSAGQSTTSIFHKTFTLSNPRKPSRHARATVTIVKYAVDWGRGADPRPVRTWRFSGFQRGANVYGHFVFHGKVIRNYRFGKAKGACGVLHRRAAGIPVPRSKLRAGNWTFQFDTFKNYQADRAGSIPTGAPVAARYVR